MKEFDLRPFEVKKPTYYTVSMRGLGAYFDHHIKTLKGFNEAKLEVARCVSELPENHWTIKITTDYKDREWTFDDIQVGWFFKCHNENLMFKVDEDGGILISTSRGMICITHVKHDSSEYTKITNVYDCPELAKVLMIERIIT
jgi:hypothetical protein